jgi:hypothetical protein
MKNQSALEFMTIVATGLLLLVVASYFGYNYIINYTQDIDSLNARQMSSNLVSAVNLVYSQGVGAKTRISFTVPANLVLNKTYASNREINVRFGDPPADAVGVPAVTVYGTLPTRSGPNALYVEMKSDGAELRIEDTISLLKVVTYSNAAHTIQANNFTRGSIVYYSVRTEDFSGNATNTNLSISVYRPDMSISSYGTSGSSNGFLNGSFVLSAGDKTGYWLVSALQDSERIIGTKLVYVS